VFQTIAAKSNLCGGEQLASPTEGGANRAPLGYGLVRLRLNFFVKRNGLAYRANGVFLKLIFFSLKLKKISSEISKRFCQFRKLFPIMLNQGWPVF
jgi:hypothetical protein